MKSWAKRHWPRLRLRTILFATLFVVAALPGVGAVGLRVYENTLVRQTEAELVAQGAVLAATAALLWPAAPPGRVVAGLSGPDGHDAPDSGIDLSTTPILPERPAAAAAAAAAAGAGMAADAVAAARRLAPVATATRAETLAAITLLDRAGIGPDGSYAALPEVAAALHGRSATVLRRNGAYRAVYRFEWLSRAAAIRVHHARPIVVNGRVVGVLLLSRSARALFKGLYEDRGKIALGIVLIFGTLVLLSGLLSRGIARPIEALGAATRAVASGRGEVPPAPATAAIEIQGLYADFAIMADAIERRSRYLRDFAHAVSHEFKTPLAGIRGALELLAEHGDTMSPDERHRFLANADADADRLALLVTRLLDLARADMGTGGDGQADVAAVAHRVADAERGAGFAIEVAVPAGLSARIDAATLEAVLAGLLANSRQAGAASATIVAAREGAGVAVRVSDTGPGIPMADRGRVFEPFFTTRRTTGGTGLGLPIAASLLDAHGGSLVLEQGAGAVFLVRLR
ncbi:sensor histidine kinase [Sphingomonas sp. Leaf343]|uniref:sensor histidine kinase n=1 Tax=Sphingomonas sp. Leaf343 TaxID=1736345 RepID=UPI0006F9018E|nr:HAMP domain-containing sensor histidine kinase [Sphingomonas sp. Leaf343]KQR83672.1 histidine kinase [Sphingomonas sp. Leaf343]